MEVERPSSPVLSAHASESDSAPSDIESLHAAESAAPAAAAPPLPAYQDPLVAARDHPDYFANFAPEEFDVVFEQYKGARGPTWGCRVVHRRKPNDYMFKCYGPVAQASFPRLWPWGNWAEVCPEDKFAAAALKDAKFSLVVNLSETAEGVRFREWLIAVQERVMTAIIKHPEMGAKIREKARQMVMGEWEVRWNMEMRPAILAKPEAERTAEEREQLKHKLPPPPESVLINKIWRSGLLTNVVKQRKGRDGQPMDNAFSTTISRGVFHYPNKEEMADMQRRLTAGDPLMESPEEVGVTFEQRKKLIEVKEPLLYTDIPLINARTGELVALDDRQVLQGDLVQCCFFFRPFGYSAKDTCSMPLTLDHIVFVRSSEPRDAGTAARNMYSMRPLPNAEDYKAVAALRKRRREGEEAASAAGH